MSSTKIQQADYLRRMMGRKLDKVDPKLSFHARVRSAMAAMDEEFGPEWRAVMDEADPESPVKDSPLDSAVTDDLFNNLRYAADEEGLPEPPESLRKYGERPEQKQEVTQTAQQPLVVIIHNRVKSYERKGKPTRR